MSAIEKNAGDRLVRSAALDDGPSRIRRVEFDDVVRRSVISGHQSYQAHSSFKDGEIKGSYVSASD